MDNKKLENEKKIVLRQGKKRKSVHEPKNQSQQKTTYTRKYLKVKLKNDKKLNTKLINSRNYMNKKLKRNSTVNYEKIDIIQKDNQQALPNDLDELVNDEDIKKAQKEAFEFLNRTQNEDGSHSAIICVCCEWFIIGTEKIHWVSTAKLLEQKHRLSTDVWEKIYDCKIPEQLQKQYEVQSPNNMLHGMLLTPKAKRKNDTYTCCQKCFDSLKTKTANAPPKFAIANGFALGSIPEEDISEISDVLSILIAPIRPFMYVVAFRGGSNKQLRGTCSFYSETSLLKKVRTGVSFTSNNPSHAQSVMDTVYEQTPNPNIYVNI